MNEKEARKEKSERFPPTPFQVQSIRISSKTTAYFI